MSIQVWKKSLFGSYHKVASGLYVYIREGRAFASWVSSPVGTSKAIPVSDELAASVLGAKRMSCPHVGTQPAYSMFGKPGYTCRDKTVAEECSTIENCTVCGYRTRYDGNPRFRAAFGSGELSDGGHPHRTYLTADKPQGRIMDAAWEEGRLTTTPGNGALIIWARSIWHVNDNGAEQAARRTFPEADMLSAEYRYLILQDDRVVASTQA